MGCTSSKHAQRQAGRDSWNAPIQRTVSMPIYRRADKEGDRHHMVALTSTSHGILRVQRSADKDDGFLGLNLVRNDPAKVTDDIYSWSMSDSREMISTMKLRSVKEVEEGKIGNGTEDCETIKTWALMKVLDEGTNDCPAKQTPSPLRRRMLDRSVSSHIVQEMDAYLAKMGSSKFSVWRKYFQGDEPGTENAKPLNESPLTPPAKSRFNLVSPSYKRSRSGSEGRSFSPKDWADGSSGLRVLLSSSAQSSPSHSFTAASALIKKPSLNGRTTLNFDGNTDSLFASSISLPKSPLKNSNTLSVPGWVASSDSSWESNSPLFDPVLIATFEKALESVCESNWDSSNESTTTSSSSCSENASISSETSSDVDSPQMATAELDRSVSVWKTRENELFEPGFQEKADGVYGKKLPFSKVSPWNNKEKDWEKLENLEKYELRCPPGGEGKVVLYFTSLRGVRKTFEDCGNLRLIFRGLRMHVDERDVWMHSKFRQELTDLLVKGVTVPRLFIKGRYIGGAEEVKQLHEDGVLVKLLEGLPTEDSLKPCDGCGDVRFIPCLTCNGSCKVIAEDKVAQCPDCNENGLIMCPLCS